MTKMFNPDLREGLATLAGTGITKLEVEHIAVLARIGITPEECEQYQGDLSRILDFVDELKGFEETATKAVSGAVGLTANPRTDRERNALPEVREQIIANMPHTQGGALTVRKVL
jgi:aspartyl-tRNA(Asn)/glutamyl-tRNA(Gln) amidotransferase subunit C